MAWPHWWSLRLEALVSLACALYGLSTLPVRRGGGDGVLVGGANARHGPNGIWGRDHDSPKPSADATRATWLHHHSPSSLAPGCRQGSVLLLVPVPISALESPSDLPSTYPDGPSHLFLCRRQYPDSHGTPAHPDGGAREASWMSVEGFPPSVHREELRMSELPIEGSLMHGSR